MKKIVLTSSILFALPFVVFAQQLTPIKNLVGAFGAVVNLLIPILIACAVVIFFWGLIKYIFDAGKGHDKGKNIMIAGLASLFVMASLWGIIQFAQSSLGIGGNTNTISAPRVQ